MVENNTTNPKYVSDFALPITFAIVKTLGILKLGPAKSSAKAGPLPIPNSINDLTIGTSVNVEKYIRAPMNEAIKFELKLLPPT